jgi:hypothetical protein
MKSRFEEQQVFSAELCFQTMNGAKAAEFELRNAGHATTIRDEIDVYSSAVFMTISRASEVDLYDEVTSIVDPLDGFCSTQPPPRQGPAEVTVEHVHVHSGGQAVVGVVGMPGGGDSASSKARLIEHEIWEGVANGPNQDVD